MLRFCLVIVWLWFNSLAGLADVIGYDKIYRGAANAALQITASDFMIGGISIKGMQTLSMRHR
jgi:hypothetical protein